MSQCKNHWCESYGNKSKCDGCKKNDNKQSQDEPYLQVLIKRRAVKQMELDRKNNEKTHKQR